MAEIENAEALTKIFGEWPSFHDAEVLRIRLDNREGEVVDEHGQRPYPTVECDIHLFEMTDVVTPKGFYETRNHTLVTLSFEAVAGDNSFQHFSFQNPLVVLKLEPLSAPDDFPPVNWKAIFDSSMGLVAELSCETVRVVRAVPYEQ